MIQRTIQKYNDTLYTDDAIFYGLEVIFLNLLGIFTILFTGFFIGDLRFSVIFLVFFIPLRLLVDGYHCKSFVNCEITFSLIYLITYYANHIYLSKRHILLFELIIFGYIILRFLFDRKFVKKEYKKKIIIYSLIVLPFFCYRYYRDIIISIYIINFILRKIVILKEQDFFKF